MSTFRRPSSPVPIPGSETRLSDDSARPQSKFPRDDSLLTTASTSSDSTSRSDEILSRQSTPIEQALVVKIAEETSPNSKSPSHLSASDEPSEIASPHVSPHATPTSDKRVEWVRHGGGVDLNAEMMPYGLCIFKTTTVDSLPSFPRLQFGDSTFILTSLAMQDVQKAEEKQTKAPKDLEEEKALQARRKARKLKQKQEKIERQAKKETLEEKLERLGQKPKDKPKEDTPVNGAHPKRSAEESKHTDVLSRNGQTQPRSLIQTVMRPKPRSLQQVVVQTEELKNGATLPRLLAQPLQLNCDVYIPSLRRNFKLYNKLMLLDQLDNTLQALLPGCHGVQSLVNDYIDRSEYVNQMATPKAVIVNEVYPEDTYIPVYFSIDGKPSLLYVHHWVSKGSVDEFNAVRPERGVMSLCYIGSRLLGCSDDNSSPFIKHDFDSILKKIEHVILEKDYTLFEMESLAIVQHFMTLLQKNRAQELCVHLPIYDYLLIGAQLFLRDKIELKALNEAFWHILSQGAALKERLIDLGRQYGIKVTVESPFQTLFENINPKLQEELQKKDAGNFVSLILNELGIPFTKHLNDKESAGNKSNKSKGHKGSQKPSVADVKAEPTNEHNLVKAWLRKMMQSTSNPTHRAVWQDLDSIKSNKVWVDLTFKKDSDLDAKENAQRKKAAAAKCEKSDIFQSITDIDTLFKVGNAAFKRIASRGKPGGSVWSFEDVSERQIQHTDGRIRFETPEVARQYGEVVNFTCIPRVHTHGPKNTGNAWGQRFNSNLHKEAYGFFTKDLPRLLQGSFTPEELRQRYVLTSPKGPGGRK